MDPINTAQVCIRLANYIDGSDAPSRHAVASDLQFIIGSIEKQAIDWGGLKDKLGKAFKKDLTGGAKEWYRDKEQAFQEWLNKRARIDSYKKQLKNAEKAWNTLNQKLQRPSEYIKDGLDQDGSGELAKIIIKYIKDNPGVFEALDYDRVNSLMRTDPENMDPDAAIKALSNTNLGEKNVAKKKNFNTALSGKMPEIQRYIKELIDKADTIEDTHAETAMKEFAELNLDSSVFDKPEKFTKAIVESIESDDFDWGDSENDQGEDAKEDDDEFDGSPLKEVVSDYNDSIKAYKDGSKPSETVLRKNFQNLDRKLAGKYVDPEDFVTKIRSVLDETIKEYNNSIAALVRNEDTSDWDDSVTAYADAHDELLSTLKRYKRRLGKETVEEITNLANSVLEVVKDQY
jgi:hypothetical protein